MQRLIWSCLMVMTAIVVSAVPSPGGGSVSAADEAQGATWLSYYHSQDARKRLGYAIGARGMEMTEQKPDGLKLPADIGEDVRFGKWNTPMDDAGFRHVALARSAYGQLCDQLVIDSDGDGQLDDETIYGTYNLRVYGSARGRVYFDPVAIELQTEDGPTLYHLNVNVYCGGPGSYNVTYNAGGWYQGTVMLNGEPVDCQLLDNNANGTFNDTCEGDEGYGDTDRVRFGAANSEAMMTGHYVKNADKFYAFSAAKDGAYVTVIDAVGLAVGKIIVPEDFTYVKVFGPEGSFNITPDSDQQVPCGDYHLVTWQREVKDKAGKDWRFGGSGFPEHEAIAVATDKPVTLVLSDPWNAKISDNERPGRHTFNQQVTGRYGEQISASYTSGGRPPAPRMHIVSADNQYDRTFKFEYG